MSFDLSELDRVEGRVPAELPGGWALRCSAAALAPDSVVAKATEVMRVIAAADPEQWPSDEEWRELLPAWFLDTFGEHTLSEYEADPTLWDLGSWIDAMQYRSWLWWSGSAGADSLDIILEVLDWPYSVAAFECLLRHSGAEEVTCELVR